MPKGAQMKYLIDNNIVAGCMGMPNPKEDWLLAWGDSSVFNTEFTKALGPSKGLLTRVYVSNKAPTGMHNTGKFVMTLKGKVPIYVTQEYANDQNRR